MAKFVIAGKSNCPYYAKAELLGDALVKNLPNFEIYKKVVDPNDWSDWLEKACAENEWTHMKSPLIWRELVYRGGKAMLVGDANDFQEYVRRYYGYLGPVADLTSNDLRKISAENEATHQLEQEEKRAIQAKIKPLIVTISNASSPLVYYFINELLNGSVFGPNTEIVIRLFDRSHIVQNNSKKHLLGLKMEIEDLASEHLRKVKVVKYEKDAFENCDFAILLDDFGEFIEEADNQEKKTSENPYIRLAEEIDQHAKTTCKILITPFTLRREIFLIANIFGKHLKRIDARKQVIGNSLCDEMLVKSVLSTRLKVDPAHIKNVMLVGQGINASFYVDLTHGEVTDYDGAVWARTNSHWRNLVHLIADRDWIKRDFVNLVHERETQIKEKIKHEPLLAFAQSVVTLCRLWSVENSNDDTFYSAIVNPNGSYSIKEDIFISVPVKFNSGAFHFVPDLRLQTIVEDIINDTKERIEKKFQDNKVFEDSEFKASFNRVKYE